MPSERNRPQNRRYKGAQIQVHGVPAVQAVLAEMATAHGKSVERALAKRALRAMLRPITAAIKRDAPTRSRYRKSGNRKQKAARVNIRRHVGSVVQRNRRKNLHEAKSGLNVKRSGDKQFLQAHLYTLGSSRRATDAGLNRGRMGPDPFVLKARQRSQTAASQAGLYAVQTGLPIEVEKVRRRHEKRAAQQAAKGS